MWLRQNSLAFYLGPVLPPRADDSTLTNIQHLFISFTYFMHNTVTAQIRSQIARPPSAPCLPVSQFKISPLIQSLKLLQNRINEPELKV